MINWLVRWLLNALALILVSYLIPGFTVESVYAALVAAIILGLVNIIIKPFLILITLPINILTLGLFTFVINALMLLLVSSIVKGFTVSGFWPALVGGIILTLIGWLVGLLSEPNPEKNVPLA